MQLIVLCSLISEAGWADQALHMTCETNMKEMAYSAMLPQSRRLGEVPGPSRGRRHSSSPGFVFPCWSKETQAMQTGHFSHLPNSLPFLIAMTYSANTVIESFLKGSHVNSGWAHMTPNDLSSIKHHAPLHVCMTPAWILFFRVVTVLGLFLFVRSLYAL